MKKNITIKNAVPNLLETLWAHDDCPKWLQDVIWDGIENRIDGTEMSATYWASQLESAKPDEIGEHEGNHDLDPPAFEGLRIIQGGVQ